MDPVTTAVGLLALTGLLTALVLFSRRHRRRTVVALLATLAMVVPPVAGAHAAPAAAAPVPAQSLDFQPMATEQVPTFELIEADLEFILDQIQISEAHAHATITSDPSYTLLCQSRMDSSGKCVRDPMLPHGLRTVDGSFNNLEFNTDWGRSNTLFPRRLPIHWRTAEEPGNAFTANPGGEAAVCGDGDAMAATCYEMTAGYVTDSSPRMISNLIVDSSVNNPAAVDAAASRDGSVTDPDTGEVFIPNTTSDEELSAPVNLWFVFFGQFFDHGLDLVNKGGSGTLIVPLRPDDPLYNSTPPNQRFMMLDRATNQPGPDGILGTADDVREQENRTTAVVDQNQTYTSHPVHQAWIREYQLVDGRPLATGRLLNGADRDGDGVGDGLATWNDVKTQAATVLGIELTDADVLNIPQLLVDPYGNVTPGSNGFPVLVTSAGEVEGTLGTPVATANAARLNQSFLDDIAHGAAPAFSEDPLDCGPEQDPPCLAGYDNVLLGDHFITGDGRGNENVGLTAVHHVFHSEHNRMADAVKATLRAPGNEALLAAYEDDSEADDWSFDERVFQAARFGTEMQYQHLVFEEFARTISPTIDDVVFNENSYDSTIDPSIKAEFAHVVYRFGHSMLTTDIEREMAGPGVPAGGVESMPLLDGFLNPVAFHCAVPPVIDGDERNVCPAGQELDPEDAAGAIVNGTTNQVANQVDELITSTLRNNLLGLPLDLATINLLRARDTGVPPLNAARATFYAETGAPELEPYQSWEDFGFALRNGNNFGRGDGNSSLINFVAAYGQHQTVLDAETLNDKRIAAEILVDGVSVTDRVTRIAGPNRYGTAGALSQSRFAGGAPVVYVAQGTNFPDALAGGPAAAGDGGPLLLVGPNSIPAPTALELIRLNPAAITVLGGEASVSAQVMESLQTYTSGTVRRLSGADRYATAAAVSNASYPSGADTVFVASGTAFPDALAAGPAAAMGNAPLLLVRPGGIPAATATELARLAPDNIVIVGGSAAVSDAVATALGAYGNVTRLFGDNRYETAVQISQATYPAGQGGTVYVSTGTAFPDALAASAVAGIAGAAGGQSSPILLVPGSGSLPASVAAEILRLDPAQVVVVGGDGAVSLGIEAAIEALFPQPAAPADRTDFMRSEGTWADRETGLDTVDFWVGGLAEAVPPFGGLLGSTFNYVFEEQLEDLQFGDRFYYLFRNQGEHLFHALEANSFSSLIQRNTNASLLPANIFVVHEPVIDLENLPDPLPAQLSQAPDGTWRWNGDEHVEIHGDRTTADRIRGGQGDDALWGYGGNDVIEGGSGNDTLVGGPGDDILTDVFGDDTINGGAGNDAINAGPGLDLILAGPGNDFAVKTAENSAGATAFLGLGNDIFVGGSGRDNPFGGEGDDWLEGGAHADLLVGDNGQQFENDTRGGNDVLIGGPGSDDMDAEGGDDIMVGENGGTDRFHGMYGFDWVTYYGESSSVDADLNYDLLQPPDVTAIRDRFRQVEGLSGGAADDIIRGRGTPREDNLADLNVNKMTEESLDLVDGLEALLRPPAATQDYAARFLAGALVLENDGENNLLLGGSGHDIMEGRTGDDFIDGDAYLRVQLEAHGQRYDNARGLQGAVFSGAINPGDIGIVREIVVDPGAEDDVDTLVYAGAYWPEVDEEEEEEELEPNFTIELLHDNYWRITDTDDEEGDGSDIVRNIEVVRFGDGTCLTLNDDGTLGECQSLGFVTFGGQIDPPTEDEALTAEVHFEDGEGNVTVANPSQIRFNWQIGEPGDWEPSPTGDSLPNPDGRTDTFTPDDADVDEMLRVVVTFRDDEGRLSQIASGVVGTEEDPFPSVENVNDAPSDVALNTLDPVVGQALLAGSFTDADGIEDAVEEGLTYTWQSSGDGFADDVEELAVRVTGDDVSFGYLVQPTDVGRQIRVVITYEDDHGTEEEIISPVTNPVVAAP